jgi:hypothetical protein
VAEVISRPRYFEEHTAHRLEGLTEELGAAVTEQALTSILEQIVFETGAATRAPRHAVTEVIETIARELIVRPGTISGSRQPLCRLRAL